MSIKQHLYDIYSIISVVICIMIMKRCNKLTYTKVCYIYNGYTVGVPANGMVLDQHCMSHVANIGQYYSQLTVTLTMTYVLCLQDSCSCLLPTGKELKTLCIKSLKGWVWCRTCIASHVSCMPYFACTHNALWQPYVYKPIDLWKHWFQPSCT